MRLAREPGKRESRYAHLFSGEIAGAGERENREDAAGPAQHASAGSGRMDQLERRVSELEIEVAQLKQRLKPTAGE